MKMKTVLSLFCVVGFVGWCLWSCDTIRSYSNIPEIHFKSLFFEDRIDTGLEGVTTYAVLTFSFIDGDGDIGVRSPHDSVSKIHCTWYKKLPDRTYDIYQFPNGTIVDSFAIPWGSVMNKEEAHNKTLKGSIERALFAPTNIPQEVDTMQIRFFIVDRARNKSNVAHTPDFSIQNPPAEPITK